MANWRVIVSGDSSDGFFYRLEDVDLSPEISDYGPFIVHANPLEACSVAELKKVLTDMLAACDKPTLVHKQELVQSLFEEGRST